MDRADELTERFYRRLRGQVRGRTILWGIFVASGLILGPSWGYVMYTFSSPTPPTTLNAIDYLMVASFGTTLLSVMGLGVLNRWGNADIARRLVLLGETLVLLEQLKQEHPELIQLKKLSELLENEKAQVADRRNFWVGVAVNFAFTLLGFALSYAATKLGWMR